MQDFTQKFSFPAITKPLLPQSSSKVSPDRRWILFFLSFCTEIARCCRIWLSKPTLLPQRVPHERKKNRLALLLFTQPLSFVRSDPLGFHLNAVMLSLMELFHWKKGALCSCRPFPLLLSVGKRRFSIPRFNSEKWWNRRERGREERRRHELGKILEKIWFSGKFPIEYQISWKYETVLGVDGCPVVY